MPCACPCSWTRRPRASSSAGSRDTTRTPCSRRPWRTRGNGACCRGPPDAGPGAGAETAHHSPVPSPLSPEARMTRTQRWTLAVVCAATAMLMLDIAVVNTALSRIAEDLNTGLSGLQWVVDAYTLTLAAVVLTAGSLADRIGRRVMFTIGLSIFTLTSLACAAASDIV